MSKTLTDSDGTFGPNGLNIEKKESDSVMPMMYQPPERKPHATDDTDHIRKMNNRMNHSSYKK